MPQEANKTHTKRPSTKLPGFGRKFSPSHPRRHLKPKNSSFNTHKNIYFQRRNLGHDNLVSKYGINKTDRSFENLGFEGNSYINFASPIRTRGDESGDGYLVHNSFTHTSPKSKNSFSKRSLYKRMRIKRNLNDFRRRHQSVQRSPKGIGSNRLAKTNILVNRVGKIPSLALNIPKVARNNQIFLQNHLKMQKIRLSDLKNST